MKLIIPLGFFTFVTFTAANYILEDVVNKANNEIKDELMMKMMSGAKSSRMNRKKFTNVYVFLFMTRIFNL